MAYMSQEKKKAIHKNLKPILKKYGLSGTLSVRHHSTLVLNIRWGKINFFDHLTFDPDHWTIQKQHIDVNPYHFRNHFTGVALDALTEIFAVLNDGNWNKSDIMTDYHNVGWYVDVNIGQWNKPYAVR